MTPEPVRDLVIVTAPSELPPKLIPTWLSSGAIYHAHEIGAWARSAESYELVSMGSASFWPAAGDPLPIYQVRPVGEDRTGHSSSLVDTGDVPETPGDRDR